MEEIIDIIAHKIYNIQENKGYVNMNRYFRIVKNAMTIDRILKIEDEKERMHISDAEYLYEAYKDFIKLAKSPAEIYEMRDKALALEKTLNSYNLPVTIKEVEEELLKRVSAIHMDAQKSR